MAEEREKRPVQDLEIVLDCMRLVIQCSTEPLNVFNENPWYSLDRIIGKMETYHYDHYLLYKPNQLDIDVRQTVENAMLAMIIAGITLGGFKYDLDTKRVKDPYIHQCHERRDLGGQVSSEIAGQITPLTASLYYLLDRTAPYDLPTGYRSRPLNKLAEQVKSPEGLLETYLRSVKQNYLANYPGKFPIPWLNMTPVDMYDDNGETHHKELFVELIWANDLNGPEVRAKDAEFFVN